MSIDKRYIDLIAQNKTFTKVPRWFAGMSPVFMLFSAMIAIVGFYQGAMPLFVAGLVILVGVVVAVVVVNKKNRKWQKRFLEKCSRSGRLPDWDWPKAVK